ncbi:uncharacterized protein N7459_001125 [Penicillium hispanicum]|uniref:uncharacterized protein n=1 Tax=Penicillium hispanicum TaxID=1080232 RepID=UPI0025411C50|nr:uncharacterized protein N7459_001125 [Penicillium hispanicum]KAJ5594917.1 hypothetical protein N7459_001125 [Penicillium hispanicum]
MANYRGPSKGCERCRRLKVKVTPLSELNSGSREPGMLMRKKCDTQKPSCERCQKADHSCLYQNEFDRMHRDQNSQAKSSAVTKWRQRAEFQVAKIPCVKPDISLYDLAWHRFCYDFVNPLRRVMQRLPSMMLESPPDSCLNMAVAAVAYTNFYSRCKSLKAKEASGVCYGKTLQKLAVAMADPMELQRDEALLVIFLLGLYEILSSSTRDGSWMAHMKGTQTPPVHLDRWIEQISFEFKLKKQLARLMSKAATTCQEMRGRCSLAEVTDSIELAATDLELLQSALTVDAQLRHWTEELPAAWTFKEHRPIDSKNRPAWSRALLDSFGAPEYMYIYSSPLAACDMNICRATRVRLHLMILEFLSKCSPRSINVQILRARSLDWALKLTDEIAETIPYLLNFSPDGLSDPTTPDGLPGMKAYMVLWPTFTGFACFQHAEMETYQYKRAWFKTILYFLRDVVGIAKATLFLEQELSKNAQGRCRDGLCEPVFLV